MSMPITMIIIVIVMIMVMKIIIMVMIINLLLIRALSWEESRQQCLLQGADLAEMNRW